MTYYNEIDRHAAQWLRELIADGLIPPGDVDERDIRDVRADDLRHYEQCHFFAGIGGWPYALRLAGWPEDRPVWTGSCPCQPFSVAGKGCGEDDERHLWPAFRRLISECRPPIVFGEQVAGKDGLLWLAGVRADLEAEGYVVGAADLCAAGVGAPHIRQRLYWVAISDRGRCRPNGERGGLPQQVFGPRDDEPLQAEERSPDGRLADTEHPERRKVNGTGENGRDGQDERREETHGQPGTRGEIFGMADSIGEGLERHAGDGAGCLRYKRQVSESHRPVAESSDAPFWSSAIWHPCRDGKARRIPAESDVQPIFARLSSIMGDFWIPCCDQLEKEAVNYGNAQKTRPGKVLRALWCSFAEKAVRENPGGHEQIPCEEILLLAVCELAGRPHHEFHLPTRDLQGIRGATMRILWGHREPSCSPYQRRLDGSSPGKPENPLHQLPSINSPEEGAPVHRLRGQVEKTQDVPEALSALEETWRSVLGESAAGGNAKRMQDGIGLLRSCNAFPLSTAVAGRVMLLRGAGNAIVPQVAAEFIKSVMEVQRRGLPQVAAARCQQ